jgi:hypothetical protein
MLFASPEISVAEPIASLHPVRKTALAAPLEACGLARLVNAFQARRRLQAWNRAQPRPHAYRHCPARVWRRRSALLTLLAEARRP